jgi:hypothetical protein
MRHRVASLLAGAVILGVGALPSASAGTPLAIVAKKCRAGYVHARIGGQEKCLHSGEFCSKRYARDYQRYGFKCVHGHLRRHVGSGY